METPITDLNQVQSGPVPGAVDTGNSGALAPQAAPVAAAQSQTPITAPAPATAIPPVTATSKNPAMHSFISRVLGAFAGSPPVSYTTSPEGKLIVAAAPPDTSANRG